MNGLDAVDNVWNNNNEVEEVNPSPAEAKLISMNEKICEANKKLQKQNNRLQGECSRLNSKIEDLNDVIGPANVLAANETLRKVKDIFLALLKKEGYQKQVVKENINEMLPHVEAMLQNQELLCRALETAESPVAKGADTSETIKKDENVLYDNLKLLKLLEKVFCKAKKGKEKENESIILSNLKENEKSFNGCLMEMNAQHLSKVEKYREGLKNFIDYLKEHEIKSSEHHSIAQHLFFLDEEQVKEFNHTIPVDIKKFMTSSMEEVSNQSKINKEWTQDFEAHHDMILKDLLEIKKTSHNIEWKFTFYQYKNSLFREATELKNKIAELAGQIGEVSASLSNAKKHRESVVAQARDKKDAAIKTFNGFVDKAKELSARVEDEKRALMSKIKDQATCTLQTMCDTMNFYNPKMETEMKGMCHNFIKDNSEEMELHLEALKVSLNLITYDLSLNAAKPSGMGRDSIHYKLKQLASSIETNGGKPRGYTYRVKELAGWNNTHGIKALDAVEPSNNNASE